MIVCDARMLRPALIFLILAVSLSAQPAEWRALLDRAVEADDGADYAQAEALFTEACDQARAFDSTEHQVEACVGLAHVYAIDRKLDKTRKTLRDLIDRLESAPRAHAFSYAQALLEAANVETALARFDDGVGYLRRVQKPISALRKSQTAWILAGMAEFYLPVDRQAAGGDLLRSAIESLESGGDPEDVDYVRALVRVSQIARWYDRPWEAKTLLEQTTSAARRRLDAADLGSDRDLARAYADVSLELGMLQQPEKEAEELRDLAKQLRELADRGPEPHSDSTTALKVGGEVQAPVLLKKREPSFTLGGSRARAAGTVLLAVEVWPDGRAHNIRVLKPLPYGLAWEAIGAVRKWRFQPASRNGEAVKVSATIEVKFQFR